MATATAMGMIKLKLMLMAIEAKRMRATTAAMANMDFSPFLFQFLSAPHVVVADVEEGHNNKGDTRDLHNPSSAGEFLLTAIHKRREVEGNGSPEELDGDMPHTDSFGQQYIEDGRQHFESPFSFYFLDSLPK